jgi:hypothetical protein
MVVTIGVGATICPTSVIAGEVGPLFFREALVVAVAAAAIAAVVLVVLAAVVSVVSAAAASAAAVLVGAGS